MKAFAKVCDRLSSFLVVVATLALAALIAIVVHEVFVRYLLNAPTMWAIDIVNLLNATLIGLGAAYTQKIDGHVRIDIISSRFPPRFAEFLALILLLFAVLPALGILAHEAAMRTWETFLSGQLRYSAWKPVRWIFYFPVAVGLSALWLQCLATAIRKFRNVIQPQAV